MYREPLSMIFDYLPDSHILPHKTPTSIIAATASAIGEAAGTGEGVPAPEFGVARKPKFPLLFQ